MEKMDIKKRCRFIFSESASGWAKFPKANLWGLHKQDVLQAGCPPCQSVEGTYRTPKYMTTAYVTPAIMYDIPMQLMGNMFNVW